MIRSVNGLIARIEARHVVEFDPMEDIGIDFVQVSDSADQIGDVEEGRVELPLIEVADLLLFLCVGDPFRSRPLMIFVTSNASNWVTENSVTSPSPRKSTV